MEESSGWVKLYHKSGALVTFPIPTQASLTPESVAMMTRSLESLLAGGFTPNLPGVGDGETVEEIALVVHREKINDDETVTPVIDFYPPQFNFRILSIYLNELTDVAAFEAATGIKLGDVPVYPGDTPIERGKNPKTDKYVFKLPAPVKVVYTANPRYEGPEDKKHPKRLFVRYFDAPPPAPPPAPSTKRDVEKDKATWKAFTKDSGLTVDQCASVLGCSTPSQWLDAHPDKTIDDVIALFKET